MIIEGYEGICRECFDLILIGDGAQIRKNGLLFHKKCIENPPNKGYYIKKERQKENRRIRREVAAVAGKI